MKLDKYLSIAFGLTLSVLASAFLFAAMILWLLDLIPEEYRDYFVFGLLAVMLLAFMSNTIANDLRAISRDDK